MDNKVLQKGANLTELRDLHAPIISTVGIIKIPWRLANMILGTSIWISVEIVLWEVDSALDKVYNYLVFIKLSLFSYYLPV